MKNCTLIITLTLFVLCSCRNNTAKHYNVTKKDSANFSISGSYLYPEEKFEVKVNGELILTRIGEKGKGKPAFWMHFFYPNPIKKIQVTTYFKGKKRQEEIFTDTLVQVKQRTVIISGPFPKGMTKKTYKPYGFVPPEKSERLIFLVDDAIYYKGTWVCGIL